MSDKKWSDYWKKYRVLKDERPTITITPRIPRIDREGINKRGFIFIILLIAVLGLSFLNFRTGSYVKVLENDKASLENELALCKNQTLNLTSNLTECNEDLSTCEDNLASKTKSLSDCRSEKSRLSSDLSDCQDEVETCSSDYRLLKSDYDDLENDYYDCRDSLSDKEDDLAQCQDDYDELMNNLRDHAAKDKCCGTANNQTYSVENNDVVCYGDSSGDYSLSC